LFVAMQFISEVRLSYGGSKRLDRSRRGFRVPERVTEDFADISQDILLSQSSLAAEHHFRRRKSPSAGDHCTYEYVGKRALESKVESHTTARKTRASSSAPRVRTVGGYLPPNKNRSTNIANRARTIMIAVFSIPQPE